MGNSSYQDAVELFVRELDQLFDSMDPSPFHEKDLDRNAEEYIVASVKELHARKPSQLVIHLDKPVSQKHEEADITNAIHKHFTRRAMLSKWEMRQLIRRGLISLAIGFSVLASALIVGEIVKQSFDGHVARVIGETLHIGGWVAMWHPMEIFLYEWWPLLGNMRIYRRLSKIPIKTVYAQGMKKS